MMSNDLILRVQRIYSAIGETEETNITKFSPKIINDGHKIGLEQDWSGGLSEADLTNVAHSLIHNIANIHDHLRKWAACNGKDENLIEDIFNSSQALKVITDLSNNDKHGYPPRNGGYSGKSPRIDKVIRFLRMTTKEERESFMRLTFTSDGVPEITGDGTAKVIISGDILDRDGNNIGDLYNTALESVKVWESVLSKFGISC